jgi:hypothetical protein
MDALPAVNRPPLCTPSPILGSGSLSPLPVNRFPLPVKECPRLSERRVPGSSPGGSTGVSRYGSGALPSPQPTHVSRPGVRRPRIATLSSPSPRTPGWAEIRVNVDTSGRGVAGCPQRHALTPAAGNRRPKRHTITGPRPGRPVGIHHSRPETLTRHAARAHRRSLEADRTRPRSRPGLERPAHKAVTACRTLGSSAPAGVAARTPQTRIWSLVLIANAWVKTPTVAGSYRANTGRRRRSA